jgi:hypothetical protein
MTTVRDININLNETRSTVINWPNELKQIIDGYRSWHSISHGVQKDAVQNAWDARIDRKDAHDWQIEFELIETNDLNLFLFGDQGTTGLTGKVLTPDELELDLPIEERWGRFENVAFTKEPSEKALGARGRGKFIFLGASKNRARTPDGKLIQNLILYDTLRPDGEYRLGFRTITTTDSRIRAFHGNEAVDKLKDFTRGLLEPLKTVGTRVIIMDPLDELVEDVKNGNFKKFIEETWWQIIKNYDAKILVKIHKRRQRAGVLSRFRFPEKESKRYKIWNKKNIKLPNAPTYLIKNLYIAYDAEGNIPDGVQGISVQRGGMKVCSIPARYVDKTIANSIYGYVDFDESLEEKLREDEGPEHYSFDFKKIIPRLLKQFIEDECERFFRDKLGINVGVKPKTYETNRSAEIKALYQVNKIAAKLGIIGKGIFPRNGNDHGEKIKRPIRLKLGKIGFPTESARVDYEQDISSITLTVVNDTPSVEEIGVRFSVIYDEQEEVIVLVNNQEFKAKPNSSIELFMLPKLSIKRELFRFKGKYTFSAKLVSLNSDTKGEILHHLSRHFWVEENPPQKGIFEDIDKFEFPKEKQTTMGFSHKSETGSYVFSYNTAHPAKRSVEDDETQFMKYLIELMGLELAWIDLRSAESKIFSQLEKEDPSEIARRISRFLGEIKFNIN